MANRNRIKMSAVLFNALIGRAEEGGIALNEGDRWIKRLNDLDAEIMAKGDCDSLVLSRQQRTMFVSFGSVRFFLSIGFPYCDSPPPGLSRIDATPALFALAFHNLHIEPTATSAEIRNVLQDQHDGISGYSGHDLSSINTLFPAISYFEVDLTFSVSSAIERMTGSYACRSYDTGPLMLEEQTKLDLCVLFEGASDHIPFLLILQGVLSFTWGNLFLEMYRCLEYLYSTPRLAELSKHLLLDRPFSILADLIEQILSWRPKEDESLIKVLQYCSKGPVDDILFALDHERCSDYNQAIESAGRRIYQLRNSLVHYRPSKKRTTLSDVNWNLLTRAMASIIAESYNEVGARL